VTYSCPNCGWETDEIPEAVTIQNGPFAGTTRGAHSDQSTHVCPECDHEGWWHGWTMEGTPEA